jgi:NAD(P)H-flavin reductase
MPESYNAVAERIIAVSPTTRRFILRMEGPKPLVRKAGQFVMADLPKPDGTVHKRAYSVSSPPHEADPIELVLKTVEGGYASHYFFNVLKEGGSFAARGPFGAFVIKDPAPRELVFVATGTGVAPLRSMIHDLYHRGEGQTRKLWLFLGIRYESEILYEDEFRALAKQHDFTFIPTISRPKNWSGEVGYVQDKIAKLLPSGGPGEAYACGGDEMIKALGAALAGKGWSKERLHYEIW